MAVPTRVAIVKRQDADNLRACDVQAATENAATCCGIWHTQMENIVVLTSVETNVNEWSFISWHAQCSYGL